MSPTDDAPALTGRVLIADDLLDAARSLAMVFELYGAEAARAIRQAAWGANMVLIALTGWGRESDLEAARGAGFDGHLLKPVDPEALVRVICDLRRQRHAAGDPGTAAFAHLQLDQTSTG